MVVFNMVVFFTLSNESLNQGFIRNAVGIIFQMYIHAVKELCKMISRIRQDVPSKSII